MRGKWIEKIWKLQIVSNYYLSPCFFNEAAQKKYAWIDLKMIRDKKTKLKI